MLKARAGNVVIFGLSEENLKRLREGQPIDIDMAELGEPGNRVLIFYGETEERMRRTLAEFIGPDTVYRDTTPKQ